jgi:serine/threonine protein kinase
MVGPNSTRSNGRSKSSNAQQQHNRRASWLLPGKLFSRRSSVSDLGLLDCKEQYTEFFASLESNTNLAFFHKSELAVGDLMGRGTFTEIHAIAGFQADGKHRSSEKRTALQSTVVDGPTNKCQYVMKHLATSSAKASNKRVWTKAARELVNDSKFLARVSSHPNIVTLRGLTMDAYGTCLVQGQWKDFFLIQDRVSTTLADRIAQWRAENAAGLSGALAADDYSASDCDPNEDLIPMKCNYAFQIAKALQYLHSQGILYRDLKPLNVGFALHDPHTVQLLDFGLARDFPARSPNSDEFFKMSLAGTRRYMDGHVFKTGEYGWKSDVYSWACTFYEALAERKPYQGLTAADHQKYVCERGERPTLTTFYVPEELDDILTAAWHPDYAQRLSMSQVCDKMQTFLMNIDVTYYEHREGDFLFDIEMKHEDVDALRDDELLDVPTSLLLTRQGTSIDEEDEEVVSSAVDNSLSQPQQQPQQDTSSASTTVSSNIIDHLFTSHKSLESSHGPRNNNSLPSVAEDKPRKMVSSAA